MEFFNNVDWVKVAFIWVAVEQVLAGTSLKSNSVFQLVCNIVDSVIAKVNKGEVK